jgi:sec-independent protein translocase protein TatB
MFDFAWSELAVIAGVALVLIGPKDMPVAIRSITGMIKKARRMAGEFQTHVDEMLREANLDEVKSTLNEIRNFDLKTEMERHVDPDGSLRSTFADNPLEPSTPAVTADAATAAVAVGVAEPLGEAEAGPGSAVGVGGADGAPAPACSPPVNMRPAFMPPGAAAPSLPTPAPEDAIEPPAFIPPAMVSAARARGALAGNAGAGNAHPGHGVPR